MANAMAERCKLQQKSLNTLGMPNRKGWSQRHKASSRRECQSLLCQKEKEQSHQSKSSDREVEESKEGKSLTFPRKSIRASV